MDEPYGFDPIYQRLLGFDINGAEVGGVKVAGAEHAVPMAELLDLTGKAAVVTGGARGLGFAVVNRLTEAGASVMIVDVAVEFAKAAAEYFTGKGRDGAARPDRGPPRRAAARSGLARRCADRPGGRSAAGRRSADGAPGASACDREVGQVDAEAPLGGERAGQAGGLVGPDLPGGAADLAPQVAVLGGREHVELLASVGAVRVPDETDLLKHVKGPVDGGGGGVRIAGAAALDELGARDVALRRQDHPHEHAPLRRPAQAVGAELVAGPVEGLGPGLVGCHVAADRTSAGRASRREPRRRRSQTPPCATTTARW